MIYISLALFNEQRKGSFASLLPSHLASSILSPWLVGAQLTKAGVEFSMVVAAVELVEPVELDDGIEPVEPIEAFV